MARTLNALLSIGLALGISLTAQGQGKATTLDEPSAQQSPKQLVEAAVRDYAEGIYNVQPERIAKSVSSELAKYGFWRANPEQDYLGMPMSYAQLMKLAANYNVDHKQIPKGTPIGIEVLGLLPKIAVVKLTASWGIDYMQLAEMEGVWKIRQVIWQSNPDGTPPATDADKAAVKQAATDYATAFYTCDTALIEAAVHPQLAKFGFYNGRAMPMDFEQLKALCATAYKNHQPSDPPKAVEILDCLDQTASVKLTGAWGIDFMLLHREGKAWKIRKVIWQSHPPAAAK